MGAKQRDKKVTPLFEKLPSAAPPLQPVSTFLRCRSGGAAKGPKNQKKNVIFVKAVTKTGASVWPGYNGHQIASATRSKSHMKSHTKSLV
jgi:hypothetical protein